MTCVCAAEFVVSGRTDGRTDGRTETYTDGTVARARRARRSDTVHSLHLTAQTGEVTLKHVPDTQMPADFLTK